MQHERAAIMALTFCIGFTTALIAYGIPVSDAPVAYVPATQTAALMDAEPEVTPEAPSPTAAPDASTLPPELALSENGLYLIQGETETLISVSAAAAPDLAEAHTAIHQALVSPSGEFVFYCAVTATSDGDCYLRVFDATNFEVRALTVNNEVLIVDPTELSAAWSSDNRLQVNQHVSVSSAAPWVMR
ncbi:hypothetical protein CL655_03340 [bacterium]|nr:hypothetical protein [bacterium]|tara:strand:+ start:19820 stop:20383 length:564 start_codon:yes stop_codon:yes gene_type:complete